MMAKWQKLGVVVTAGFVLAGCMDQEEPLAPGLDRERAVAEVQAALDCRGSVRTGEIACAPREAGLPAGVSGAVLGGQGRYVLLAPSNVSYDAGSEIFSADVSVRNLLTQTLGTVDGTSVAAEGVLVFFHDVGTPIPSSSGPITVQNADGEATLTKADQPYFHYPQALSPGKTSLPKTWRWHIPGDVESFSFSVFVATSVADEGNIVAGLRIDPTTISAGHTHTCALSLAGKAYCWGRGDSGRLGNGTTTSVQSRPVEVWDPVDGPALQFASISAGSNHTCALTTEGRAYCWGGGTSGQLGDGTAQSRPRPVAVVGPEGGPALRFVSIDAGARHTCALTISGKAYCWGFGMLDWSAGIDSPTPVPVQDPVGLNLEFTTIRAGGDFSCALTTGGKAYCWGNGYSGQLGDGAYEYRSVPTAVVNPPGLTLEFASISTSHRHTCAVTTLGKAYCWGLDDYGQLGADSDAGMSPIPLAVANPPGLTLEFASIDAGYYHTCAVTTLGKAYCWGYGGRLGDGGTGGSNAPVAVVGPGGGAALEFASISAGGATGHGGYTCAVTTLGKAYCWGDSGWGQLGNNDSHTSHYSPVAVWDPEDGPALHFASLSADGVPSCERMPGDESACGTGDAPRRLGRGQTPFHAAGIVTPRRLSPLAYLREGSAHSPRG